MVDLRGFSFDEDSLHRLATNNRASLETIILPAGVNAACLAALLVPLQALQYLSVAAADLPGLKGALPQDLCRLNVRGKIPTYYIDITIEKSGVDTSTGLNTWCELF